MSIVDCLEGWAEREPNRRLSSFLDIDGNERESYTYLGFRNRTNHLAAYLSSHVGMKKGDRALLIYPPGLEIIAAFVACARIGVLPVPVCPPLASADGLEKVRFIVDDCQAAFCLTTTAMREMHLARIRKDQAVSSSAGLLTLENLAWVTTDDVDGDWSGESERQPGATLFLQYTSGSTSQPKGVVVSHENVIHNARATTDHEATGVCWLPQYHDMGLIGYYLFPLVIGGTTYGFSPLNFLRRPLLWFELISRTRATYASGPNFAFEYCLREDKVPAERLRDLDLSSLRVLMNASEPSRPSTCVRFLDRFSRYGLRPEALVVAYGLAEHCLAATHYGRRILTVNKPSLQQGNICIEDPRPGGGTQQQIISCGRPLEGVRIQIVDPVTRAPLADGKIGEVWLAGQSVCGGYWNKPALTREVFQNHVGDGSEDQDLYVRTGDLGFRYDDELFVCGRKKDLIIIRGINYYPQDIEAVAEASSPKLRPGGVVAFDGGSEDAGSLVVVAEVSDSLDLPDPAHVFRTIRASCKVEPSTIAFVRARKIVRTTSGKLARNATRQSWLRGELPVIATHSAPRAGWQPHASSPHERLSNLLDSLRLAADEGCTFADVGLDSLERVTLVCDIEDLLEEYGACDFAKQIDLRALETLEVSVIASLLERLQTDSDEAVEGFRRLVAASKEERSGRERVRMRNDATLGFHSRVEVVADRDGPVDILLTGATGFFGPFLLDSLLRRTDHVYYVLIRADGVEHGMQRIRRSLQRSRLWTASMDAELQQRVRIACGDVARPNIGMNARAWDTLSGRVQAVVHNAAHVNYVRDYEELRSTNVEGTRELIRFSLARAKKAFHLISSTTIHGWTNKEVLFESDANCEMRNLDFGYAQTKWVSEQLAFAARKEGVPIRVYRPSFISASSGGVSSQDDVIIRLLSFMINHGIAPRTRNQLSFVPADVAADNIASIFGADFRATSARDPTLHITANDYYNLEDVTRLITRNYGVRFEYHDMPSFVTEMRLRSTPDDLVYPLLDFFSRACPRIVAMQNKRYSNECYRAARDACGGQDEPSLSRTVSYLMSFLIEEGLVQLDR